MLTQAVIRRYAVGQRIDTEVADQEIVLHYALALLAEAGLTGQRESRIGPLLFKGGTALRKCIFGSTGRFSQDIDFDVVEQNGFEAEVETAFSDANPYCEISFGIEDFRYSQDGNFSATIGEDHGLQPSPRRIGKDVYDLYLWAQRPFSHDLVRRLAVLKCWTDQRRNRPLSPRRSLTHLCPRTSVGRTCAD